MRKIFAFIISSLDGYHEGPNHEFDWPLVDEEFLDFSVEQLDEADTLLFGRTTYEGMAAYWPTPDAMAGTPEIAQRMNDYPKVVVSTSLARADWAPTRIIRDDVPAALAALKQEPGRDIAILGSSDLTARLLPTGAIDEVRIMVNPLLLGAGRTLLRGVDTRVPLRLLTTRAFASGNVLLTYRVSS